MSDCRENCPIPNGGYCERHGINKTPQWVQLCLTKEKYWRAWEETRGPAQVTGDSQRTVPPPRGPGTELRRLFRSCGITSCGGCVESARKMDEMGVEWCREHIDELAAEIHENATKRKWTALLSTAATLAGIEGPVVRWAILEACNRAEQKGTTNANQN